MSAPQLSGFEPQACLILADAFRRISALRKLCPFSDQETTSAMEAAAMKLPKEAHASISGGAGSSIYIGVDVSDRMTKAMADWNPDLILQWVNQEQPESLAWVLRKHAIGLIAKNYWGKLWQTAGHPEPKLIRPPQPTRSRAYHGILELANAAGGLTDELANKVVAEPWILGSDQAPGSLALRKRLADLANLKANFDAILEEPNITEEQLELACPVDTSGFLGVSRLPLVTTFLCLCGRLPTASDEQNHARIARFVVLLFAPL